MGVLSIILLVLFVTSKFLTKATTILAIAFVVLALLVGLTTKTDASSSLLDTAASVQSDAWYNASSAPAADAAAETATVSE